MHVSKAGQRKPTHVQPYRWTRQEYEKMVEIGLFPPETRLELIEGEIWEMAAHTSYHAAAITVIQRLLEQVYSEACHVRVQLPLALSDDSEPEPDLAVVEGGPADYWHEHPHTALLIVEVAYSPLDYDQERKRHLYARNGLPEYWILNLQEHKLEVYCEPQEEEYLVKRILRAGDTVAPLSHPSESIAIADLLPR